MEVETVQSKTVKDTYSPEELKALFGNESVTSLEARLLTIDSDEPLQKAISSAIKTEKHVTKLLDTLTSDATKTSLAAHLFWGEHTAPEAKEAVLTRHIERLSATPAPDVYAAAVERVFPFIAKSRVLKSLVQILDLAQRTLPAGAQLALCREMLAWADPALFARRKEAARARRSGHPEASSSFQDRKSHTTTSSFIVYRLELREAAILYSAGISAMSSQKK